jgi:ubiquinone/menaquinone biosynthesis C-methylase UbiE
MQLAGKAGSTRARHGTAPAGPIVLESGRMEASRTLTHHEAQRFYDRFGARQDTQAFYEDAAVNDLLAHIDWPSIAQLMEFGCGTGRTAERVLKERLPAAGRYLGLDLSSTMVGLARQRLQPFGVRAEVQQSTGPPALPAAPASIDAVLSCYVLDLLSPEDIRGFVAEAHRVLRPGGQLALVSLTHGCSWVSRTFERVWTTIHRLRPALVGGCRPVALRPYLDPTLWSVGYDTVILRLGISSEVLVAVRRPGG